MSTTSTIVRSESPGYLVRGFLIWLLIVFAESVSGTLRRLLLEPAVGDFPARRIGFFIGMVLIFLIALLFVKWIKAPSITGLFRIGLMWMLMTACFEIGLGWILGYSRERIFEDYDVRSGGIMAFGLLFMVFAPTLAAKLRRSV
jgi:hypothetical protein